MNSERSKESVESAGIDNIECGQEETTDVCDVWRVSEVDEGGWMERSEERRERRNKTNGIDLNGIR